MNNSIIKEIEDYALAGYRPAHIKHAMGGQVSSHSIYRVLRAARDRGVNISKFPTNDALPSMASIRVHVQDEDSLAALDEACKKRGVSRHKLVNKMMALIFRDGMIDAILDD